VYLISLKLERRSENDENTRVESNRNQGEKSDERKKKGGYL
jgi:hypothetical protein